MLWNRQCSIGARPLLIWCRRRVLFTEPIARVCTANYRGIVYTVVGQGCRYGFTSCKGQAPKGISSTPLETPLSWAVPCWSGGSYFCLDILRRLPRWSRRRRKGSGIDVLAMMCFTFLFRPTIKTLLLRMRIATLALVCCVGDRSSVVCTFKLEFFE